MSECKPCTPEMLQNAKERLERGESKQQIAKSMGISEAALRNRIKKGFGVGKLGRFNKTFDEHQESELAEHCRQLDEYFYGLTSKDLRRLTYDYAEINKIENTFDKASRTADKDWAYAFMKRHLLTLRTPQKTSLARVMGFNKVQTGTYFDNLSSLMVKYRFPPHRIFNIDELGVTTVPNRVPKVIYKVGIKAVGKIVSAERGQLFTVICCMGAGGNYVPPAIIFPRKRLKEELLNGVPPGTVMMCSDSGYINSDLFLDWLKHFQNHVAGSKENPVLLILDNHSSHLSLNAVLYCRENNIHVLSIPPHSSHKLQPLDRCFFKALKDFYSQECDTWLLNNPGRVITQFQIAEIFGISYQKCATMNKAIMAFKVCGICPVNRDIFGEEDFMPSSVTDQDHSQQPPSTKIFVTSVDHDVQPSTSTAVSKSVTSDDYDVQPSTSAATSTNSDTAVSPRDIAPYPKRKGNQKGNKKGKRSEIVSGTPFKEQLENQKEERLLKTSKKSKMKLFDNQGDESIRKKSKGNETGVKTSCEEIVCPGCEEPYTEPPTEDWIQCSGFAAMRVLITFIRIVCQKMWNWLQENVAECWIFINVVLLGFLLLLASSVFLTVLVPEYAVDMDFLSESNFLPVVPITIGILNFITTVMLFRRIYHVRPSFMLRWVMYYAAQALFILVIGLGMGLCILLYLPQHANKLGGAISISMLTYYGIVKVCLGFLCILYLRWNKEYTMSLRKNPSKKGIKVYRPHFT